jgi:hypothetical protein
MDEEEFAITDIRVSQHRSRVWLLVLTWLCITAAMFLFPPWTVKTKQGYGRDGMTLVTSNGYHCLFVPPELHDKQMSTSVDIPRLVLQVILTAIVTGVSVVLYVNFSEIRPLLARVALRLREAKDQSESTHQTQSVEKASEDFVVYGTNPRMSLLECLGVRTVRSKPCWFFLDSEGKAKGPLSRDALVSLWRHGPDTTCSFVRRGEVSRNTLVWRDGMDNWLPFRKAFRGYWKGSATLLALVLTTLYAPQEVRVRCAELEAPITALDRTGNPVFVAPGFDPDEAFREAVKSMFTHPTPAAFQAHLRAREMERTRGYSAREDSEPKKSVDEEIWDIMERNTGSSPRTQSMSGLKDSALQPESEKTTDERIREIMARNAALPDTAGQPAFQPSRPSPIGPLGFPRPVDPKVNTGTYPGSRTVVPFGASRHH